MSDAENLNDCTRFLASPSFSAFSSADSTRVLSFALFHKNFEWRIYKLKRLD